MRQRVAGGREKKRRRKVRMRQREGRKEEGIQTSVAGTKVLGDLS